MYKILVFALFFVGFLTQTTLAEVYKCKTDQGVKFQDTPCVDENKQELVTIKGDNASSSSVELTADSLVGKWCEFATSLEVSGTKDSSAPATWHFKSKDQMSYTYKSMQGKGKERFNQYSFDGSTVDINNSMIGSWEVESFSGSILILSGPYGGYAHLRRGGC